MPDPALSASLGAFVLSAAHIVAAAIKRSTLEYRLAQCELKLEKLDRRIEELGDKIASGEVKDALGAEARTRELLALKETLTVIKNDVGRLVPPAPMRSR